MKLSCDSECNLSQILKGTLQLFNISTSELCIGKSMRVIENNLYTVPAVSFLIYEQCIGP